MESSDKLALVVERFALIYCNYTHAKKTTKKTKLCNTVVNFHMIYLRWVTCPL